MKELNLIEIEMVAGGAAVSDVINVAQAAVKAAGGEISHQYILIKGFASKFPIIGPITEKIPLLGDLQE